MKCQNCGVNEANVNLAMNVNNQKMQVHLCDECFREIQGQMMNSNDFFSGSPFENTNSNNKYFQGNGGNATGTKEREKQNNKNNMHDKYDKTRTNESNCENTSP